MPQLPFQQEFLRCSDLVFCVALLSSERKIACCCLYIYKSPSEYLSQTSSLLVAVGLSLSPFLPIQLTWALGVRVRQEARKGGDCFQQFLR